MSERPMTQPEAIREEAERAYHAYLRESHALVTSGTFFDIFLAGLRLGLTKAAEVADTAAEGCVERNSRWYGSKDVILEYMRDNSRHVAKEIRSLLSALADREEGKA